VVAFFSGCGQAIKNNRRTAEFRTAEFRRNVFGQFYKKQSDLPACASQWQAGLPARAPGRLAFLGWLASLQWQAGAITSFYIRYSSFIIFHQPLNPEPRTQHPIKAISFRGRMCVLEELSHHFLHSHPFLRELEKKWECRFVL
jgi:hypothetical protein